MARRTSKNSRTSSAHARRSRRASGTSRKRSSHHGTTATDRVLSEMTRFHAELSEQCNTLQSQIAAVSEAIDKVRGIQGSSARPARPTRAGRPSRMARRGRPPGKRRGRSTSPAREGSLKDYILRVLGSSGSAMRLVDLADAVKAAGYPTRSKNLPNQVNMAVVALRKKKLLRKVGRGTYRV